MRTIDEILEERIEDVLNTGMKKVFSVDRQAGLFRGLVMARNRALKKGWYPGDKWAIDNLKALHESMERKYYSMLALLRPDVFDLISPYMKGIVEGLEYARKIAENKEAEEK